MARDRNTSPLIHIPASVSIEKLAELHGHTPGPKLSLRDRLRQETQSTLNAPAPDAGMRLKFDTEVDDSWSSMPVEAIHFYEDNPRKANNEAYSEIKESIRVQGILQPLTITKRPGESHYILYAGGNTRLQAIQELWQETGNLKYRETRVIIKAWRGESAVLLSHMAENTQRSDMTFWDRANGTLKIKRQIEAERGITLSHREFEAELKQFGVPVNLQSISAYRLAIEKLPDIGPWLAFNSIRTIQPRLNLLMKLAGQHAVDESSYYAGIVNPAAQKIATEISTQSATFSADAFLTRCEENLAVLLELNGRVVGKMLSALERFPDMALEELQRICKPSIKEPVPIERSANPTGSTPSESDRVEPVGQAQPPLAPVDAEIIETATVEAAVAEKAAAAPPPPSDPTPQAIPQADDCHTGILPLVQRLIAASGLASCYEAAPGMPLGYLMGFSEDGPLDLHDDAQSRQSAWWILATASRQFEAELCRDALPEGNKWRTLIMDDANQETMGGLELELQHNIGGQGEYLPIQWLLNPGNPVSGLCLELLASLRNDKKSMGTTS